MEHIGDGRLQELEKSLLESRMANARLMEDNESFQLLLGEKTLKGDFTTSETVATCEIPIVGSLADELESAGLDNEQSEAIRKLEAENKSVQEENKALTLYIDRIIGRLLQHEGLEHIIHDEGGGPEVPAKVVGKALPPPLEATPAPPLLQRPASLVGQGGRPSPKRPVSHIPATTSRTKANEDPQTAPSIPLGRGHRRGRSDQTDAAAVALIGQMSRNIPVRTPSGNLMSPSVGSSINPNLAASRVPFFQPATHSGRSPSRSGRTHERDSGSNSVTSHHSGDVNSVEIPSPPNIQGQGTAIPGAVMKQNQLRPLRLVREQSGLDDDDLARRKANRGTWMGWFNRGLSSVEDAPMRPAAM